MGFALLACRSSAAEQDEHSISFDTVEGVSEAEITRSRVVEGNFDAAGVGDLNDDGYDDVAVAFGTSGSTDVCWFPGGSDGLPPLRAAEAAHCERVEHASGLEIHDQVHWWPIRPVRLGDLNRDGVEDLGIWIDDPPALPQLQIHLGRSDFDLDAPARTVSVSVPGPYETVPVAQRGLDQDADIELILRTDRFQSDPASAYVSTAWTIPAGSLLAQGGPDTIEPRPIVDVASDPYVPSMFGARLRPDGLQLVVDYYQSRLTEEGEETRHRRLLHSMRASESADEDFLPGQAEFFDVVPVDWDCDGLDEFAFQTSSRVITFLQLDEQLLAVESGSREVPGTFPYWYSMHSAGDLDGDGCGDLLVGEYAEIEGTDLRIVWGGPQPELGETFYSIDSPLIWGLDPVEVLGDINGDGSEDLLIEHVGDSHRSPSGFYEPQLQVERMLIVYGEARP